MSNLTECKDCGHEVSKAAESCPNCGAPQKKKKEKRSSGGCAGLVLLGLVGLLIIIIAGNRPLTSGSSSRNYTPPPSDGKISYWAKNTVNVRRGPGTEYEVVDQLSRGQQWRCYPQESGSKWVKCAEDEYIHSSLLSTSAPPPFEIEDFNFVLDPDFGGNGAVIWNAEIRNNTSRYVDSVRVEFSSYDTNDRLITTDFSYAQGLSPGGTAAVKGYATYYGREATGSVRVVP